MRILVVVSSAAPNAVGYSEEAASLLFRRRHNTHKPMRKVSALRF